jgi:hypothetical protein
MVSNCGHTISFTAVGYGLQFINPQFIEGNNVCHMSNLDLIQINTPGYVGNFSILISNNVVSCVWLECATCILLGFITGCIDCSCPLCSSITEHWWNLFWLQQRTILSLRHKRYCWHNVLRSKLQLCRYWWQLPWYRGWSWIHQLVRLSVVFSILCTCSCRQNSSDISPI